MEKRAQIKPADNWHGYLQEVDWQLVVIVCKACWFSWATFWHSLTEIKLTNRPHGHITASASFGVPLLRHLLQSHRLV
ncbi:hypothetical protein [Fibrivirga algicola]|uniref:Uncharacterized protein n=1 Tax=Fibrivirga algicola TaxID=2950420 RepID=A0ABX0QEV7_9BACT|nr:hypothetical protein [Fibrivirga algicola]NID08579.1 hypothetical protein [Fibrivirga algicola]